MKVKLIAVLIAVAALFVGAVLWRTDSFIYGDRMSWVEAQTRTQLGAINHSLSHELKSLERLVLGLNAESFEKGKMNWNSVAPYYAVAAFTLRGSELEPQALAVKENSKAANWTTDFIKSAVGTLGARGSELRYFVKPFQDSQRGRYVALVFLQGNRAYAVIGSGEIFQSLIDAQKGSLSSFSIVTTTGLTVGHSIPEYLGTVMRDDPIFREALRSGSSHGSSIQKLKAGQELYGMFEVVPQSNLLALSSAPLGEAMKGRAGLWWQFLLLGLGLMMVGAAAALWVISPAEKVIDNLEKKLEEARLRPAQTPVAEKVVALDPEMAHKDKLEASMRVASALAHEMRGPLASILGYSQMILAKTPDSEVVQNTDSIIRETRAARAVLDKLLGYAGEEVKEKNSMKVEGPLVRILKEMEPQFSSKGVRIIKNIQETSPIDLHVEAVAKAIGNILVNSVEAMERMAKKEIKIDLFEDAEGTHLIIEDTGEGIELGNIEKVFDPFYTTRSFQHHMGLGLSVAFGILKEHNAEMRIESQRGQGTRVEILFRKSVAVSVMKAPEPVIEQQEEEVIVMRELPRLKEESEHRAEAEAQFEQSHVEQVSAAPSSPLDVNIENLLEELPEANEVQMVTRQKEKHGDAELVFIDGFLGDEQIEEEVAVAEEAPLAAAPAAGASFAGNEAEVDADIEEDLIAPNFITPPKSAPSPKISKLNGYQVQIRRPGKRI